MHERPAIFMPSPINAVLEGLYESDCTMGELRAQGDFGIGTFNDLDGELVMLDGVIYHLDIDGNAQPVGDEVKTPFAAVCKFDPVSTERVTSPIAPARLDAFLDLCLPSRNMMYAIRIDGRFSHVHTRSVPRTANYTPLVDATAAQQEADFYAVDGTLVGFFTPDFLPSVNVPGYHFHFMNQARTRGGHLLDCALDEGEVAIQFYTRLDLNLPMTLDYLSADFKRDARKDLEKAER
jgi:acetolactate decarboxylase